MIGLFFFVFFNNSRSSVDLENTDLFLQHLESNIFIKSFISELHI